ncbi:MAG: nicotinate-nucleotide adenylyltransferase [Nitrospiraceae bacterium]|nr:nicotinate-nucleotide adenylyltransferase [Nitrospiraceae bacterium]
MRLGILGGTFNPVHYGHMRLAQEVMEKAVLDAVLFVPSGQPPLKENDLASPNHRMQMVRLAISSNPGFMLSDVELYGEGKSYTVSTISALKQLYPADELFFIIGSDAFIDMPNWKEPYAIISSVNLIVAQRPCTSAEFINASLFVESLMHDPLQPDVSQLRLKGGRQAMLAVITQLDISSSDIRDRIKKGLSIKYLLPPEVEEYIRLNKLYLG